MRPRRCNSLFTLLAASFLVTPALAQDPVPAGDACAFEIVVDAVPGHGANFRLFTDDEGNTVRVLITGTSTVLTFSNPANGKSYTVPSKGSRQQVKFGADGITISGTGHTVISFAASDDPSSVTILFTGHVQAVVEDGALIVVKATGRQVDICEILAD